MITPLPVFIAELTRALSRLDDRTAKVTSEAADRIVKDARSRAPERTGALRGSITASRVQTGPGVVSATVSAGGGDVSYAGFVEFGTSRTAPQPFMRPAVDAGAKNMESQLADELARIAAGR